MRGGRTCISTKEEIRSFRTGVSGNRDQRHRGQSPRGCGWREEDSGGSELGVPYDCSSDEPTRSLRKEVLGPKFEDQFHRELGIPWTVE